MSAPRDPRWTRRTLATALALAPLGAFGCGGSSWEIRRELAPFAMPRHVSIMVFKSQAVRNADRDGYADLVASTLQQSLASTGTSSDIVPLAGSPRLPRIELAFYVLGLPDSPTQVNGEPVGFAAITLDCAFVSANDEVAFIGRVTGRNGEGNLSLAAEAAASEITKALTHG
jgi:hypothetical protein